MSWDYPNPHVIALEVAPGDIDEYRHVNNAVYLTWFDRVAWSHSALLGLPLDRCLELKRGMAALHTEIDYLRAAMLGDALEVATWIVRGDGRLRVGRRFQVRRVADDVTLARARIDYVCLNLDTGRATRMPELFAQKYVPTAEIQEAGPDAP